MASATDAIALLESRGIKTGIHVEIQVEKSRALIVCEWLEGHGPIVFEDLGWWMAVATAYAGGEVSPGVLNDIKDKLYYIAYDFEAEMAHAVLSTELEKYYDLPDGQVIQLGTERFRCPEVFFKPSLIGYNVKSLPVAVYDAIKGMDPDLRRELYRNVVVTGTYPTDGLVGRLQKELAALAGEQVRVVA